MSGPARLAAPLLALVALSCSPRPTPDGGRTFLLLTIDTLRADHLGTYGYPRGTSPELDRFAAGATTYLDCVSVSSWTMPAMGTLATGLRPNEHGMVYWHLPLADVPETLAEVLESSGVATAFFGNPIPRLPGLDRGFGIWETWEGDDAAATAAAVAWLERSRGRSRFLWVHLLSPHAPYDPRPGTTRPDPRLDELTVLYDGEIRTVDRYVRDLLAAVGPEAAVIVTADHGETLDEREELAYDHGKFLFEELVRIPCFARWPGAGPSLVKRNVRLADVPVTVCDWFGIEPPAGANGVSLRETAPRDGPAFAFVVEDEPPRATDRRWSVRGAGLKAVFNLDRGTARLFDLRTDPGETTDIAAQRPEEVRRRREALERWLAAAPTPAIPFEQRFDREELERLQSLGYLGGRR